MRVWFNGELENIEIGQTVLVAHCGSGHSYFGEFGKLVKTTKQHLVFETESGAQVKTAIDNLHQVVGKAKTERYFVSLRVEGREEDPNFIQQDVKYWDDKKCCFVKR